MKLKLFGEAFLKWITGVITVGLLIFPASGTLSYYNGWILMGVLFIPMLIAGLIMAVKNHELLKRRLKSTEKQKEQGNIIKVSAVMFIFGFTIAGFDYRFGWSDVYPATIKCAIIIFLLSYLMYGEVLRENVYLSRTIESEKNQKVIDTGLYSFIRHPMYASSIILFLSMPLILGSIWAFLVFLIYPVLIIKRIKLEEEYLTQNLNGYKEYKKKVKYRIIPFIW